MMHFGVGGGSITMPCSLGGGGLWGGHFAMAGEPPPPINANWCWPCWQLLRGTVAKKFGQYTGHVCQTLSVASG